MKKLLLIISLSIFSYASSTLTKDSVVKIFATISFPNYLNPWQENSLFNIMGSGVIIDGNRILTSAHVVSGAKFIELKKENDSEKYIAKIKYISNQADLAILEIDDKKFFSNITPAKLGTIIKQKDSVTVIGYPIGGNEMSTTSGVVSRIEYTKYSWSKEELLSAQIDAAINSGNSGGGAFNSNGELIGIAMQTLTNSSNIGYIVPIPVINTFLNDIKDNKVDGFNLTQSEIQTIENSFMKKYYNLNDKYGVLVTYADLDDKELKNDDVILSIDNYDILNDGNIQTSFGLVNFKYALHLKPVGSTVKLKILRDNKIIEVPYKLKIVSKIVKKEFDKNPRYLIFGGIAFSPLTNNFLTIQGIDQIFFDMLFYEKEKRKDIDEAVFFMKTIFPHNVNRGYKPMMGIVEQVNGIKIKNFNHFVETIDSINSEYIVIDTVEKEKVILNTKEARDSFQEVKNTYGLKSDRRVD